MFNSFPFFCCWCNMFVCYLCLSVLMNVCIVRFGQIDLWHLKLWHTEYFALCNLCGFPIALRSFQTINSIKYSYCNVIMLYKKTLITWWNFWFDSHFLAAFKLETDKQVCGEVFTDESHPSIRSCLLSCTDTNLCVGTLYSGQSKSCILLSYWGSADSSNCSMAQYNLWSKIL